MALTGKQAEARVNVLCSAVLCCPNPSTSAKASRNQAALARQAPEAQVHSHIFLTGVTKHLPVGMHSAVCRVGAVVNECGNALLAHVWRQLTFIAAQVRVVVCRA